MPRPALEDPDVHAISERIAGLLARFDTVTTPRVAREQAEELVRTLVSLYGEGLRRIMDRVHDSLNGQSDAVFTHLCEDKLVEALLCLHDLHPISLEDRVRDALESVRPYLKSHEGGVDIARIEDGVVTLRLEGNCKGCPSSTATVKLAVERAILERVPEIREVRAEDVARVENPAYDDCVIVLDDVVIPAGAT